MLDDLIKERRKKLDILKEAKVAPYPARAKRSHIVSEVRENFKTLARTKRTVAVAGRIMALRDQGKLIFLDLKDESGQIQVVLKKDSLPKFDLWQKVLDRGDFISARGTLFATQKGEESIAASELQMLAKSLRPLPTEHFGLEDIELRLRERYLDLILNPELRELFKQKAVFWGAFRKYLLNSGFLEVETPTLESIPGGAEAEPFQTHHNALDVDLYLRISLELPLKKLIVGGFEKVFEIGRIFRNEGIDREHLQDYTQLEFYAAYSDYRELMVMLEKMYKAVIKATLGGLASTYQGKKIDWGKKWVSVDYVEIFKKENKLDCLTASVEELRKHAEKLELKPERNIGRGRLIDLIFKKTVKPKLIQPCFLIDPPVEIEPLAKRKSEDSRRVERLQIIAGGTELGKGFSELNDPVDQRGRFEEQMKLRAAGDKEAQQLDEDFLNALEYGMPPTAGFGVSERLFSVLMDKPIRETVFFPLMRPKDK